MMATPRNAARRGDPKAAAERTTRREWPVAPSMPSGEIGEQQLPGE